MICCPNAEVDPVAVAPEIIGHCNEDLEGNDHAGIVQQMSIIVHHDSLDASFTDGELICNMERSGVQRPKEVAVVLTEPEEKEVEQEMLPFHQDSTRIRCDSDQFARGTSTMSKKSTKSSSSSKFQKMQSGSFLEVHHELRAIPLRKSLRLAWKIWLGGKCDLWEVAVPVKRYDVFLSHTWRTRGVWKILSLVFQFGLPWLFLFWFLGVCLAIALCMLDILPLPHTRMLGEIPCHTGPWVLTFSAIGSALGLFLASLKDGKNEWCFIDKVSIHQTDPELKEEGIYGIGGALGCTKELRILWSAPYLSRLWCIFEIAAFRHANPTGKFRVAPLYVESTACAFLLFSYFIGFLFYGMSVYLRRRPTILETVIAVSPTAFLLHGLRWNNNSKTKLFSELKNFKLDQVHCSEDFDREYVLSAIASWYGSAEDFENHVRGQLSLEIASSVRRTSIPASHCFLQTTLSVAQGLQPFVSIWKCGASSDFLLRYLIAAVLAQCVFWIPVTYKLVFYLCHRFSEPVGGRHWSARQCAAVLAHFLVLARNLCGGLCSFNSGLRTWHGGLHWLGTSGTSD